jgi:hypothetical protein
MDWIEKLTGFAPDSGGGGLEIQIMVVAGVVIALVIGIARRSRS